MTKLRLIRPGELERAILLAQVSNNFKGPVLVMLDADDDCPARLGTDLKRRVLWQSQAWGVSIAVANREFETWFLTAAKSLAGKRGLREDLSPPEFPEKIRGAKEWLSKNMVQNKSYSPMRDQAALVAGMDLVAARSSRSFDRLCNEIARLVQGSGPEAFSAG